MNVRDDSEEGIESVLGAHLLSIPRVRVLIYQSLLLSADTAVHLGDRVDCECGDRHSCNYMSRCPVCVSYPRSLVCDSCMRRMHAHCLGVACEEVGFGRVTCNRCSADGLFHFPCRFLLLKRVRDGVSLPRLAQSQMRRRRELLGGRLPIEGPMGALKLKGDSSATPCVAATLLRLPPAMICLVASFLPLQSAPPLEISCTTFHGALRPSVYSGVCANGLDLSFNWDTLTDAVVTASLIPRLGALCNRVKALSLSRCCRLSCHAIAFLIRLATVGPVLRRLDVSYCRQIDNTSLETLFGTFQVLLPSAARPAFPAVVPAVLGKRTQSSQSAAGVFGHALVGTGSASLRHKRSKSDGDVDALGDLPSSLAGCEGDDHAQRSDDSQAILVEDDSDDDAIRNRLRRRRRAGVPAVQVNWRLPHSSLSQSPFVSPRLSLPCLVELNLGGTRLDLSQPLSPATSSPLHVLAATCPRLRILDISNVAAGGAVIDIVGAVVLSQALLVLMRTTGVQFSAATHEKVRAVAACGGQPAALASDIDWLNALELVAPLISIKKQVTDMVSFYPVTHDSELGRFIAVSPSLMHNTVSGCCCVRQMSSSTSTSSLQARVPFLIFPCLQLLRASLPRRLGETPGPQAIVFPATMRDVFLSDDALQQSCLVGERQSLELLRDILTLKPETEILPIDSAEAADPKLVVQRLADAASRRLFQHGKVSLFRSAVLVSMVRLISNTAAHGTAMKRKLSLPPLFALGNSLPVPGDTDGGCHTASSEWYDSAVSGLSWLRSSAPCYLACGTDGEFDLQSEPRVAANGDEFGERAWAAAPLPSAPPGRVGSRAIKSADLSQHDGVSSSSILAAPLSAPDASFLCQQALSRFDRGAIEPAISDCCLALRAQLSCSAAMLQIAMCFSTLGADAAESSLSPSLCRSVYVCALAVAAMHRVPNGVLLLCEKSQSLMTSVTAAFFSSGSVDFAVAREATKAAVGAAEDSDRDESSVVVITDSDASDVVEAGVRKVAHAGQRPAHRAAASASARPAPADDALPAFQRKPSAGQITDAPAFHWWCDPEFWLDRAEAAAATAAASPLQASCGRKVPPAEGAARAEGGEDVLLARQRLCEERGVLRMRQGRLLEAVDAFAVAADAAAEAWGAGPGDQRRPPRHLMAALDRCCSEWQLQAVSASRPGQRTHRRAVQYLSLM